MIQEVQTVRVDAVDTAACAGITVYPAPESEARALLTEQYDFRFSRLLLFGADGRLQQAGGELVANSDGRLGSPQLSVTVPAGGFAVSLGREADEAAAAFHAFAMEDAMLYNATMTVDCDVCGRFDRARMLLTLSRRERSAERDAKRFLFIGNSCIYFNGTPLKFRALCRAAGMPIEVTYCTFGSAYLREFADPSHRYHRALLDALAARVYDVAVLQDADAAPSAETERALRAILPLVERNGAKPTLYMRYVPTAAQEGYAAKAAQLSEGYRRVGEALRLTVAPVAEAFLLCRERYPELELYADDRSHHSALGSYLTACCFAERFLGIFTPGNPYTAFFDPADTCRLQEVAHETCGV